MLRDGDLVDALEPTLAPFNERLERAAEALGSGLRARGGRRGVLPAALRHAIDFATWHSLVQRGGVGRRQAVELVVALVERAATGASRPSGTAGPPR